MGKRINTATWLPKYNRWQIKVQKDGVRKTFYCSIPGRKGMRECHRKADQWLDENIVSSNLKVKELAAMYLEEKSLSVQTSRYKNIRGHLNKWIVPAIANKRIANLSEQDLQNILNDMYKQGKAKRTIQAVMETMSDFVKFARKNNLTKLYPENLTVNRLAKGTKQKQSMDLADLKILFSSDKTIKFGREVKDEWIYAYRFLALTGLRRGEMLGLKWEDVKEHTIEIKRAVNEYKEVTKGKTENAIRSIPITRKMQEVLEQIPHRSEWIFWNGCRPYTFSNRFRIYANYNGLSISTVHELRHTFITIYDDVLPINTVKSIVGHSKSMRTVETYGHVTQSQMESAKEILDKKMEEII